MRVQIVSSHEAGNAPVGYLVARVEVAPGLYAESERNPFTNGEWRWITFCLGDADVRDNKSKILCTLELAAAYHDIASDVCDLLKQISRLYYQGSYS